MRGKTFAFGALLAAVACNTATAAEAPQQLRATLLTTTQPVATASIRAKVVGGLYVARGVTSGDAVHVQVRKVASSSGFPLLTSGTLVGEDTGTGQAEVSFSVSGTGNRYLIIAIPQESGVEEPDRASFLEYVY